MLCTILVCGGRTFGIPIYKRTDEKAMQLAILRASVERKFLRLTLDRLVGSISDPIKFVAGMAKGADTGAELYAKRRGYGFEGFPAEWTIHQYAAGPIRNKQMYDKSQPRYVIGYCGTSGTKHMINYATKAGCANVTHYSELDIDKYIVTGELPG
jgi:hypothetical protein